ncbi:MAG: alpha/beta hydrolase [Proteobacteria bacterium]|nr:alpha/beta hydrolase [Pseudomonadota bacterium]
MPGKRFALLASIGVLFAVSAAAQNGPPGPDAPKLEADGAIRLAHEARFPFSSFASKQALARFLQILVEDRSAPDFEASIEVIRAYYDKLDEARVERMKTLYPVKIVVSKIDGVPVQVVSPSNAKPDPQRVLINLHWGGFMFGAGNGGLVESIPVASVSKITVVSVDYRMGPEHTFPAASEDVEKVYRELLKKHKAQDIGIYGCSAGGGLAAQSVAWIASKKLPRPGAIGLFCSGLDGFGGDSAYVAPLLNGQAVPAGAPMDLMSELPYFKGADANDPLVWPGRSPAVLAKFPPTLLISGTRDEALSPTLHSQDLLARAGAETELHVWDGMWHRFFADPDMPESQAAYSVIARFFQRQLGRASARTEKST